MGGCERVLNGSIKSRLFWRGGSAIEHYWWQFNSFIADNPRMRLSACWNQTRCCQEARLQAVASHKNWCSQTNLHSTLRGHCFVRFTIDFLLVEGLLWWGCLSPERFGMVFCTKTDGLAGEGGQKKKCKALEAAC